MVVRGNHDDAALHAYKDWRSGQPVKPHYLHYLSDLKEADVALLESLPFSLSVPAYGVLVVHAGLVPGISLQQQSLLDLYKVRDLAPVPTDGKNEGAVSGGAAAAAAASSVAAASGRGEGTRHIAASR